MTEAGERWIAVAHLLRPQGRRGELLADPLTDLDVFAAGRTVRLSTSPENVQNAPLVTLESSWRPQGRNAGRIVLKLSGTDSISAAELLQAQQVFVPEADLPALDADTFMVRDLVGCTLWSRDTCLGTVAEIQFPVAPDGRTRLQDAPDLLAILPSTATADDSEDLTLVPFVKAWLRGIDLSARRIDMDLPPGLFDHLAQDSEPEGEVS